MSELKLQLSGAQNPSFRDELITPENYRDSLRDDSLIVLRAEEI